MTTVPAQTSTIEWSPVIAGTFLACAISVVLTQFGHALGLSFTDVNSEELITPTTIIVFSLWLLWTQLSASMAGGYMAGRMISGWHGTHEGELRDGAHGLLTWAISTVVTVLVLGAAITAAGYGMDVDAEARTTISEEMAKKYGIISGFALAATSAVSAVAAWIMATIGGDHRDRKVDVARYITFRRVR